MVNGPLPQKPNAWPDSDATRLISPVYVNVGGLIPRRLAEAATTDVEMVAQPDSTYELHFGQIPCSYYCTSIYYLQFDRNRV